MKKHKLLFLVLIIMVIGIVSWGLYTKKSMDNIRQNATLVIRNTWYINSERYGV